ncbi:MAG: amidohydrolase family protein [Victivallaceae bacterium]
MTDFFTFDDADAALFEREFAEFLPAELFDIHAHIFRDERTFAPRDYRNHFGGDAGGAKTVAALRLLLPGRKIGLNAFAFPDPEVDRAKADAEIGALVDGRDFFGMALTSPADDFDAWVLRIERNRLTGAKPYLNLVPGKAAAEVEIADMLSPAQLEYLDRRGLAVMLHIPRAGRLADPLNRSQLLEFARRYPRIGWIVAHIGRAYSFNVVENLLDDLAREENIYLDTAMLCHERVLEYAFTHFPRERMFFGSDVPIAFLRGKSVEINGQYAYLTADDYRLGSSIYDARHTVEFTFFLYEELRALKLAMNRLNFSEAEKESFFGGAARTFCHRIYNQNFVSR